jgi:hypothetical protein
MGLLDGGMTERQAPPGLLTAMFGNGPDDPKSQAMMAISAGLIRGDFAGGLLAANQVFAGEGERRLKRGLLEAQIAETQAQAQERQGRMALAQQTQQRQAEFLNGAPGGVSAGAFAPAADGMGPVLPQGAAPVAGGVIAQARAMGIPEEAIKADVLFNGGKKISELLAKHGARDMQVTNGFAYDKNRLPGGFMPSLNTSQDGKTSMVQIDPNTGLPVVSAPAGAQSTYAGYRNIDESAKANFDPVTVTPAGQPPQMTSRGALMRNPQVQGRTPVADAGRLEILNQEVTKAQGQLQTALRSGDQTAAQRATNDLSALNREIAAAGGQSRASVGMPLQSEAERTRDVKDAEAAAGRDASMAKGAANSRDTLNYIREARALFEKGPTASGFGSVVDAGAGLVGLSTPGADAAAQLDTLSGWMVSNVPRMEGPQSNFDVQNYKTMAAMVGDRTKPLSQRKAALDTLERLQQKYAHLNEGSDSSPSQSARRTYDALPKDAQNYRGKVATDTRTGKRYRSNGITWVEEK